MLRMIAFLVSMMLPAGLAAQSLDVKVGAGTDGDATQETKAGASATVESSPPSSAEAGIPAASEEMPDNLSDRLALGLRRWNAKDLPGALAAFEAAREMDQQNLTILLFIGGIHFLRSEFDAATQAYTMVVSTAMETDSSAKAKALLGLARIAEARYDLEGARQAWTTYKSFVSARPSIPAFVDTAEDRLRAIEQKVTLDKQYEVVQARLAPKQPASDTAEPAAPGGTVSGSGDTQANP